jgi:isopenicillin-N N-acyltransferase-like protein
VSIAYIPYDVRKARASFPRHFCQVSHDLARRYPAIDDTTDRISEVTSSKGTFREGLMADRAFSTIRLSGSPEERGSAYGHAAYTEVNLAIETYLAVFRQAGLSAKDLERATEPFAKAITERYPDLMVELAALAHASDRSLVHILALNARNELLYSEPRPECTAVAVLPPHSEGGHILLGQNLDWRAGATHSGVVLKIQRGLGLPDIATVTEAGTLARAGMNSAGIGLCVNFLNSRHDGRRPLNDNALPTQLLRRVILEAASFSAASGSLRSEAVATASNYLIADAAGRVEDVEMSPRGIAAYGASDGLLVHSNHFVTAAGRKADTGVAVFPDTLFRRERLAYMMRASGAVSVRGIMAALQDHEGYPASICRHANPSGDGVASQLETAVSVVMDLTSRRLWIAAGSPCESEYAEIDLRWMAPPVG